MDKKIECLIVAIAFIIFTIIASKGLLIAQPGDENVYYYMGKLVAEGNMPYKDFFYAHPPLQLYVISIVFKLFGFNIIFLKLIPFISTLVTAFFIYLISKTIFEKNKALISLLLFLFSYSVMFNSVFSFGISLAVMFLAIGLYFYFVKKFILAGIFFGIAGITRLLTLIPIIVIFTLMFFRNKKNLLSIILGFVVVFVSINLVFTLFLKTQYLFPVYKFHFLKGMESLRFKEYANVVKLNWILFASFMLFIFVRKKTKLLEFIAVSLSYLIFLSLTPRVFNFYFIVVFPFLAITGGYCIDELLKQISSKRYFLIVTILVIIIFLWNLSSDILFLKNIGFEGFNRGNDIRDFVLQSTPTTLLFGDDSTAPLIALMANKKIAFNFVDTNPVVFKTGIIDINKTLSGLKGSNILFLARSTQGISELPEVREFLNNNCNLLASFNDKLEGLYLVYKC